MGVMQLVKTACSLKEPVIIIGFGRSGTSIFADAFFQHPELAFISNYNAKFASSDLVNLIRYLFDNNFWHIVGQKKQLNKVSLINRYAFKPAESYGYLNKLMTSDFGRGFLLGLEEEESRKKEIREKLYKLVMLQGRSRFGLKVTGPSRLGYLNSLFPDAKFIRIKRKPLPNIKSLLKVGFYQGRERSLWWQGDEVYSKCELEFVNENSDKPELIAALQYFKINKIHDQEVARYNLERRVKTFEYETFFNEPKKTLEEALDFVNLQKSKKVDRFLEKNEIYNRNVGGNFYFSEDMDPEVSRIALFGLDV